MARVGVRKSGLKYTMRRATTEATEKFGIGGREKVVRTPRPITLPRLKFLEGDVPDADRKDRKPG